MPNIIAGIRHPQARKRVLEAQMQTDRVGASTAQRKGSGRAGTSAAAGNDEGWDGSDDDDEWAAKDYSSEPDLAAAVQPCDSDEDFGVGGAAADVLQVPRSDMQRSADNLQPAADNLSRGRGRRSCGGRAASRGGSHCESPARLCSALHHHQPAT